MALRGHDLVYGGAKVGLMGVVADAVLAGGGHVVGVIPGALASREIAHEDVQDLQVVDSMHERKQRMADQADAFIALPGGLGTLEEFFEAITWAQLGIHQKPVGLLNILNYYDGLLGLVDHAVREGFVKQSYRDLICVGSSATAVLEAFGRYVPRDLPRWLDREQM